MSEMNVIFNNTCPICSREVEIYKREAHATGAPIRFSGIDGGLAREAGLTEDQAARRFHVIKEGELYSGLEAFRLVWAELPRWRWLARVTGWPVLRPLAGLVYDHLAAPLLYRLHKRRQARR